MSETRRDFIKKGAVAGGLVWATPILSAMPAHAQVGGSPVPCACNNAGAYGLRVIIPLINFDNRFGVDGCVATVDTGPITFGPPLGPHVVQVRAAAVCGDSSDCEANASIADVLVLADGQAVHASVLTSNAHASCPCNTNGSSTLAGLEINGTPILDLTTCNNAPILPPGFPFVVLNEETCTGGTLSVNALHVTVPGVIEVIVAHSQAGATGCPCAACTPGP